MEMPPKEIVTKIMHDLLTILSLLNTVLDHPRQIPRQPRQRLHHRLCRARAHRHELGARVRN